LTVKEFSSITYIVQLNFSLINSMNIKLKTVAVPAFVALSLLFGACAEKAVESPDAGVDGTVQEGVENVQQGAEDAGSAVEGAAKNVQTGAEDAAGAMEDGAKDLQKGAEDAAGAAKDGVQQGMEEAGNAVEGVGEKSE
jgi:hypothetical protein